MTGVRASEAFIEFVRVVRAGGHLVLAGHVHGHNREQDSPR